MGSLTMSEKFLTLLITCHVLFCPLLRLLLGLVLSFSLFSFAFFLLYSSCKRLAFQDHSRNRVASLGGHGYRDFSASRRAASSLASMAV
jgi:hypothetical protein